MKILVSCRAIDNMAGGVERMAAALMNEMIGRGHDVSLLTWDMEGAQSFYALDSGILWEKLDIGDASRKATWGERWKRAMKTRRIIRNISPDVVMAFQDGPYMSVRAYTMGMRVPIILGERNAPTRHLYKNSGRHKDIFFNAYRFADKITVQFESYKDHYPAYLRSKIVSIPNPVFPAEEQADLLVDKKRKTILSVGRLGYQKNYMTLVRAFSLIAQDCPDWDLLIVGEGEDRKALEAEVDALNLSGRVSMPGAQKDVSQYYRQADLFCLPSLWEGFPNALAEALAHGLPCVGFQGCAGVADLIVDGENGALAEGVADPESLAGVLKGMIMDNADRKRMGQNAPDTVKQYQPQKIYDLWEGLFRDVATTNNKHA